MKDKVLRVAMLGHKRIPSCEGGIEVVVRELSTRMVKKGLNVTCFNRKGHNVAGKQYDQARVKELDGVKCIDVATIDKKGLAALTASVSGAIRSAFGRYDIVHFHAEGPSFMCWLPKLLGKRVIVTVHGLDHQRAKWGRFASWYILQGEKNAVRFADEIIVLSKGVQQYFKEVYGRETIFIPNGVGEVEKENAVEIEQEFGLTNDSYILYLGRIVPEKGIQYLVEAFKKVKTDLHLVIAGGSSDTMSFMEELKERSKDDSRILFTGFVQGRLKQELYSNAYVYTLPSDLEGMPLSLLEGMRYGNCCLTSNIPECADVVQDNAVLFEKGNISDLTEKLQWLCDHPEIVNQYRERVETYAAGRFDWDSVVERTVALYNA